MPDLEKHLDEWLYLLENEQQQAKSIGFPAGSIPSYRAYPLIKVRRADPNVFFPALIAVKLNEWSGLMTTTQAARANHIVKGITDTFPLYKSRRGRMHYNFWPTSPDVPFPNGRWLHRFDFFRLPDDIDDTALVYSALRPGKEVVESLRTDIERHFVEFYPQQPRLYAAWLGDKMPWVTDVCAMVNLMDLFRSYDLAPTAFGRQSDDYIGDVIDKGLWWKDAYQVAPYYPDPAVVAYHLAKWLGHTEMNTAGLTSRLQSDVAALCVAEKDNFRAMLYAICLLKLGGEPGRTIRPLRSEELAHPWFCGAMLSAVNPSWLRRFGRLHLFQIKHVCPAWNHTLWLEYAILKQMKKDKLKTVENEG